LRSDKRRLRRVLVAFAIFAVAGIVLLAFVPLLSVVLLLIAEAIFFVLYFGVSGRARTGSGQKA